MKTGKGYLLRQKTFLVFAVLCVKLCGPLRLKETIAPAII
jgi:hypothetical protein